MGASQVDETELKFDVGTETVFPNLTAAEGVVSVEQPEDLRLEAVYYDTPHHDLARHGMTLRRRSGGTDDGWTLKLPAGPDTRTEVRVPLGTADDDGLPEELRARARGVTRNRPLSPVVALSTSRREYAVCDADGGVLARVTDDSVRARLLATEGPEQTWREWEVELDQGPAPVLDALADVLLEAGATPAAVASKLARALGDTLAAEADRATRGTLPDGTAGALWATHLAEQVDRLHEQDARLRAELPESVHRLRIAARTMRSALTTFRPVLDRRVTDPVREELRWLGQELAPARDAQVLREHLIELIDAEPPELVMGPVATRIDDELGADHESGLAKAAEAINGERYLRLLDALDDLLADPPLRPGAATPARTVARRLLTRDLQRLRQAVGDIADASGQAERDAAHHEARKKAKRLRYAAEAAGPTLGKRARALGKDAKRVQKILGTHQDAVTARVRLRELGVQAHLAGENSFTYGRLHALEQARAERAEAEFEEVWATFCRKQVRRWVR
ncbi:CYTH and CHAD domain-containing protein [Intrasporangium sp. YIM S08009]|uniref:CYTH and CHAD domain-containing protein n=1 Tax=Intrasporangium zincisolvens TaxID=3080018 RepID=UPI002B059658|nr:CYTH and CHAD domain-containing protein [Intrasporangium sp. YIM S08009]